MTGKDAIEFAAVGAALALAPSELLARVAGALVLLLLWLVPMARQRGWRIP